jgi:cytochrome-b5 reductase
MSSITTSLHRQLSHRITPLSALLSRSMSSLPSTLTGPPVCSLVPPKTCQFAEDFVAVPLLKAFPVSATSSVFRFGLPDTSKPLNLSTCACILAKQEIDGEAVVRPYTPISTNADVGYFDLLVKDYGEKAKMSKAMHALQEGETLDFKHIDPNVKIQAPFAYDEILMLVGGTGVTPMIQALHAILGSDSDNGSKPVVTMLYGSRTSTDILGQDVLHQWAKDYADHFKLFDVLSHEPEESDWSGPRGYVTKELVAAKFPAADAGKKVMVFVCGPPPMYGALCGPREETEITGLLGDMGYSPDQVFKF